MKDEDLLVKKSIIVNTFYFQEENLLVLSMVDKELKFYDILISPKKHTLTYD